MSRHTDAHLDVSNPHGDKHADNDPGKPGNGSWVESGAPQVKRLPPWPGEPQWMRVAWASARAREMWEPRIQAISTALRKLELESVIHCHRNSALLFLSPQELVDLAPRVAPERLHVLPLALEAGGGAGYASQSTAYTGQGAVQFRVAVTNSPERWAEATKNGTQDQAEIANMLGYPSCCAAFFSKTWDQEKWRDTTWPMFENSGRNAQGPATANILLRWLGVRLVRHLPCSFGCAGSALVGQRTYELGRQLGMEQEMEWALEMLSWPMRWSSLHGVAEIKLPVLKISASTDPLAEEAVVVREATGAFPYPEEGVSGLGHPFERPQFLKIQHSKSFKRAFDTWTENGFTDKDGMDRAHNRLLQPARALVAYAHSQAAPIRSVLDLGCGNGLLLEKFRSMIQAECGTCGVEVEEKSARSAKSRVDNVYHCRIEDTEKWAGDHDLAFISAARFNEMNLEAKVKVYEALSRVRFVILYAYSNTIAASSYGHLSDTHDRWIADTTDDAARVVVLKKGVRSSHPCNASCCKDIELNGGLGPQRLQKLYEGAMQRIADGTEGPYDQDYMTLVPVLKVVREGATPDKGWSYSCGHLTQDGRCSIYALRPRLCREFPSTNANGGVCQACKFTPGRGKP